MEKRTTFEDFEAMFEVVNSQMKINITTGVLDAKEVSKLFMAMLPYKYPKLQQVESKNTTTQITIFGDVGD